VVCMTPLVGSRSRRLVVPQTETKHDTGHTHKRFVSRLGRGDGHLKSVMRLDLWRRNGPTSAE